MIIFVDDEKWTIEGYLDYFDNLITKGDSRYKYEHYFYAKDAILALRNPSEEINLIILDLMLDYGDGELRNEEHGGLQFLKKIRATHSYNHIPILIYSVIPENKLGEIKSLLNIQYLNRDSGNEEFYSTVKSLLDKFNPKKI